MRASTSTEDLAKTIRCEALNMVHRVNSSHIGCCLSIADILAVLYGEFLRVSPATVESPTRDRFILSKGHAAAVYYAVLAHSGFLPVELLETYYQNGTRLAGHATSHGVPGVECSTGSLGHGLSIGCGMAMAQLKLPVDQRQASFESATAAEIPTTVVLLGDGECNEGSVWEAASFAAHRRLSNLIVVVDCNGIQSLGSCKAVQDMSPLRNRWQAFGWNVIECDGHHHASLRQTLRTARASAAPTCVLAQTIKGKGVSFMENTLAWHYKSPNVDQLAQAMSELRASA